MALQEFYIRNESDPEARGPFNLEQLSSLAQDGQVTLDTVYHEAATQRWVSVRANETLKAQIFGEGGKRPRPPEHAAAGNPDASSDRVASAEVSDRATASPDPVSTAPRLRNLIGDLARGGKIDRHGCTAITLISSIALLVPSIHLIATGNYQKLPEQPFAILGAIDLVVFLMLLLKAVRIYPLVRFRATLGAGFLGIFFYAQGETTTAMAAVAGSVGLYFSTVFTHLWAVVLTGALVLASMGYFTCSVLTT